MEKIKTIFTVIVTALLLSQVAVIFVTSSDADSIKDEQGEVNIPETTTAGVFPSKLDLRDQSLVTPAKDQGKYSTCWAFATTSCIETNLIKNGYADNTIDLSELQLAYYLNNMSADELKGNEGDSVKTVGDFLNCGAVDYTTTFILSNWRGLVLESEAPYTSADPNMKLDSSLEYSKDKYIVTDVQWINSSDMNAAKKILNSGNSLVTCFNANAKNALWELTVEGKTVVTFYGTEEGPLTHAVTIIGYDDNFSADNFAQTPAGNGAWLIKNSYGTDSGVADSTGCFWLSYYDKSIGSFEAFSAVPASKYNHNYQYDGGISRHQFKIYDNEGYMSNIFKTSQKEKLEAVSFYTYNTEVDYTVSVYTSVDAGNPVSGKLAGTVNGHMKYAGYHTIQIGPISMDKGMSFSVVVKLVGKDVAMAIDTSVNVIDDTVKWATSTTQAKAGQSFVSVNGAEWTDISSDGMSNVRVKAFTTNEGGSSGSSDNTMIIVVAASVAGVVVVGAGAYFLIKRR